MKTSRVLLIFATALTLISGPAFAAPSTAPDASAEKKLYDDVKPSLVAVKYTWDSEVGKRELIGAGIIVGNDGLVMMTMNNVGYIPESQLKDFKIVVPSDTEDETEIDATFQGRDERSNLAFIKTTSPQQWKAIKFVDQPVNIGDQVYSVGMLPKSSGYKTFVTAATMSARLRGPVPQILVDGALAGSGSLVFTPDGQAIGAVLQRGSPSFLMDDPRAPGSLPAIDNPAKLFVPASDFLPGFDQIPTPEKPIKMPWLGCELKGLDKEVADIFNLKNVPATQIGDVVPDSPAEKAGLKALDIIVKMNGKPLERGDEPVEIAEILTRKLSWQAPGSTVTLSVIHQKDDAPRDVVVTLALRPTKSFEAHRFFAKDLGFIARDVVFDDTYMRKMKRDTGGVTIEELIPSGAAQAAKLTRGDLVTQMNAKPVTDLDQFKKDYQEFRKDKPSDAVVLVVSQPSGKEQTIKVEPPQEGTVPGRDFEP